MQTRRVLTLVVAVILALTLALPVLAAPSERPTQMGRSVDLTAWCNSQGLVLVQYEPGPYGYRCGQLNPDFSWTFYHISVDAACEAAYGDLWGAYLAGEVWRCLPDPAILHL